MSNAPPEPSTAQRAREIETWMVAGLARVLEVSETQIDTARSFPSYGLSSRLEVQLVGELEEWLGYELPPTLFWDYSTIEGLTAHIARMETEEEP